MFPATWTTSDLWSALQRAVSARNSYAWVVDIKPFGQQVVYGMDGKSYECQFSVDEQGAVTLGDAYEVRNQTVYWPAEAVAFAKTAVDGLVQWTGLLFRAGRFPERPIREITESDLDAMVDAFPAGGVPVMVDHNPDAFLSPALLKDGAKVRKVWRVGNELHGTVEVPSWFAEAARDLWKSVSVGLDGTLRRLNELSFVSNPRIEDAAVFAGSHAFSLFAAAHPDLAASVRPSGAMPPNRNPLNGMKKFAPALVTSILGFFRGLPVEERAGVTEEDLTQVFHADPVNPSPTDQAVAARIAELERQFAASTAQQAALDRKSKALSFYENQLRTGRVDPADKFAIVAGHEAAQIADEAQNFAAGSEQSFVTQMEKRYEALPVRYSFTQRIDGKPNPALEATAPLGIFTDADFSAAFGSKGNK